MSWTFWRNTRRTTASRPSVPRAVCPTACGRPTPPSPTPWGGVILLGVAEGADKSLYSVPLFDPQELVDEFWDMVNDPTVVSANILQPEDVQIFRSGKNDIVAIFVPRAEQKDRPVYIGGAPYAGTYYRRGEGDWRCPRHEVDAMLQDQKG